MAPLETREHPDLEEKMDLKACPDAKVPKAHLAQKEVLELLVPLEKRETKESLAN